MIEIKENRLWNQNFDALTLDEKVESLRQTLLEVIAEIRKRHEQDVD